MVSESLLQFFRELRNNNNKEWFDQNRKRYEQVRKEYHDLTTALLDAMKKEDESLEMVQMKDCTFRINKDIRFSKDKSPYKTNLGINIIPYGKKMLLAGYYLHIEEGQSFAGGGLYLPMAPELKKVRKEIHYSYDEFLNIIQNVDFKNTFGSLDRDPGLVLSRPPRDYSIEDPAIEWLKLKSYTAVTNIDDSLLRSKDLIPEVVRIMKTIKPLIGFLNSALLSDENGVFRAP